MISGAGYTAVQFFGAHVVPLRIPMTYSTWSKSVSVLIHW